MRFRNAFRLLTNNFKNTYVILLFRVVISLVTGSLVMLILGSGINLLLESAEMAALWNAVENVVATFFNSTSFAELDVLLHEALEGIVSAFAALLKFFRAHLAEIIFSCLALALLYLVGRFLNGLALFAFGDILNDKMSQYADTPFFVGFLHNVGGAAIYQLVYVPLAFVYDALSVVLCYFIFFRLFSFLSVFAILFMSVTFILVMQAVKLAFISDWIPAIITDGKTLPAAIKESFKMGIKRFGTYFSNYLMACYCILAVNVLFAVSTLFSALLITVPASFTFLICLQFSCYYATHGKRYFLSYTHISGEGPNSVCFCINDEKKNCKERNSTENKE